LSYCDSWIPCKCDGKVLSSKGNMRLRYVSEILDEQGQ
jgi:hypothetical protein